ncbi:DUF4276 family protein [Chryseobacterium sp.]|uniref:DUF4276 family protein n=1 Tax=Chryseobacterium sp. TaxID=1871047 RepID=UPI0028A23620|nr:DUF4276 family protein [Chryseobacterium sp.]
MKVGLVGEAPLDTLSIKYLLQKKYTHLSFIELLKNKVTGASLENQKTKTELRIECIDHRPDIVIFIRDLDGLLTKDYRKKRLLRQKYYNEFKGCTQVKKTIYLLNIWEIEALILSDISAFNSFYNCNVHFDDNPMHIENPKELLSSLNKNYSNSHNSKILEIANFDVIYNKCNYFKSFINKFNQLINIDKN